MQLIFWIIAPFALALMPLGFIMGLQAGRKLGGNLPSGIALGTLLAILPPLVLLLGTELIRIYSWPPTAP